MALRLAFVSPRGIILSNSSRGFVLRGHDDETLPLVVRLPADYVLGTRLGERTVARQLPPLSRRHGDMPC